MVTDGFRPTGACLQPPMPVHRVEAPQEHAAVQGVRTSPGATDGWQWLTVAESHQTRNDWTGGRCPFFLLLFCGDSGLCKWSVSEGGRGREGSVCSRGGSGVWAGQQSWQGPGRAGTHPLHPRPLWFRALWWDGSQIEDLSGFVNPSVRRKRFECPQRLPCLWPHLFQRVGEGCKHPFSPCKTVTSLI